MYGKLFRQMYHGSLATVGPWEALVTFQQFIVLADQEGVVDMHPLAIARETTIPIEIIQRGIAALEQPDPESRSPAEDGRRIVRLGEHRAWGWRIVNYSHYRKIQREVDRREYHRQRYQRLKANSNSLQQIPQSSTIPPIAKAYTEAEALRLEPPSAPTTPKKVSRRTTIDPERKPDEKDKAYALEHGPKDADWDATWAHFVANHAARGTVMANWHQAWRTWVSNISTQGFKYAKRLERSNGAGASTVQVSSAESLRIAAGESIESVLASRKAVPPVVDPRMVDPTPRLPGEPLSVWLERAKRRSLDAGGVRGAETQPGVQASAGGVAGGVPSAPAADGALR